MTRLCGGRSGVCVLAGARDFSGKLLTGSGAQPALYLVGTGGKPNRA